MGSVSRLSSASQSPLPAYHWAMWQLAMAGVIWLVLATTATAVHAQEGAGLTSPTAREANGWGRWTPRLSPQFDDRGQPQSMALLSDLALLPKLTATGGLRATGGLVWGRGSARMASSETQTGTSAAFDQRFGQNNPSANPLSQRTAAYFGLGYTRASLGGAAGWRLNADVGVAWRLTPGSVKLGPGYNGNGAALEDVLRNARLAPLMQLSASYSF